MVGFVAELHKGERVLTAEENKLYSNGYIGQLKGRIFKNGKLGNNNNNTSQNSINTNTSNNNTNFNINININYSGNGSNVDLDAMAEEVVKRIVEKLKVMKLNVV